MKYFLIFFIPSILILGSCGGKKQNTTPEEESGYTVVNNGKGGVDTATDFEDKEPLSIAQAIPSVSNQTYFANTPIIFFFNDKILISSVYNNFEVTQNELKVQGTIYINEAANGYAILTFTPKSKILPGTSISITIKKDLKDDGGNSMGADFVLTYKTQEATTISFDDNADFERGPSGVAFIGDGGLLKGKIGDLSPFQGERFAAISTGKSIIAGSALGETSSLMFLGPINKDLSSVEFAYDFISCEFNDYLNSKFDDAAMVTIIGPNGTYSEMITSVNTVGLNNDTIKFSRLPDYGDNYVGHTGWTVKRVNFKNVGSPSFVIFTITDVLDKQLSSVLTIDSLAFN